jgi:hypothetical protein
MAAGALVSVLSCALVVGSIELARSPQLVAFAAAPEPEAQMALLAPPHAKTPGIARASYAQAGDLGPAATGDVFHPSTQFREIETKAIVPASRIAAVTPAAARPRRSDDSSAGMTEEASADSAAPRAELVKAVEPTSADAPHQGQQFIVLAAWQEVETSVTQTSVTRTRAIADYDTGAGAQQQAGDTASQPATTHATEITVTRIILLVYSPSPAAPTQPAPATVSHSHRPATQSADTGRMGLQL